MKYNFIVFLLFLILTAPACSGAASVDGTLTVIVPPAAVVEAVPSAANITAINPQTGFHTGLEAVFNIKTNGDDNTYDFILSSSISTDAGEKNGYFLKNGEMYLILANKEKLPDLSSLSDIYSGQMQSNKNLIAYPVIKNTDFQNDYQIYNGNLCCKFLTEGRQDFNISQHIGSTPLTGTYSIDDDSAGIYEAVITLSIYRKP